MFPTNNCFLFFLCFFIVKCNDFDDYNDQTFRDDQKQLYKILHENRVVVSSTNDDYIRKVKFFLINDVNKYEYDILISNSQNSVAKPDATCKYLSCNIGEWAVIHVGEFLDGLFSLFNDSHTLSNAKSNDKYKTKDVENSEDDNSIEYNDGNSEFSKCKSNVENSEDDNSIEYDDGNSELSKYKSKLRYNFKKIKFNITAAYIILHDYLDFNSKELYYNDSFILKTLVSLKIKFDLISSKDFLNIGISDTINREMYRELNAVRSFLLTNCGSLDRPKLTNEQKSEAIADPKPINKHVLDVNKNFEMLKKYFSSRWKFSECTLKQVLLENIITTSSLEPYLNDILNAKVRIAGGKWMTIKEILEKIPQSYDVEMIHWYGKSVLPAILKFMCCNILVVTPGGKLTDEIITLIKSINAKMTDKKWRFPPYLHEYFTLLAQLVEKFETSRDYNTETMIQLRIKQLYNSIDDVDLKCPDKTIIKDNGQLEYLNYEYAGEESEQSQNALTKLGLLINENIDDFMCFHQYFKCLHTEFDKTYNSRSALQIQRKLAEDDWSTASEDLCKFLLDMYANCHETIGVLDQWINVTREVLSLWVKSKDNDVEVAKKRAGWTLDKAWRTINSIKDHFLAVIKTDVADFGLFEIAVDIAIVLVNHNKPIIKTEHSSYTDDSHVKHLQRMLYFVMAKINEYRFKRCCNNLLDYNPSDYHSITNGGIHGFFKNHNSDSLTIRPDDYECFSRDFLNRKFVEVSGVLMAYIPMGMYAINESRPQFISVYWKGKEVDIDCILRETTGVDLDPHYLHALYDVFFKYCIAVIYYEIKKVYFATYVQPTQKSSTDFKRLDWHMYFPKQFWPLIEDINYLVEDFKHKERFDSVEIRIPRIEKQLEAFKIIPPKNIINMSTTIYADIRSVLEDFINGVSPTVSKINECYVKITTRKSENQSVTRSPESVSKTMKQVPRKRQNI